MHQIIEVAVLSTNFDYFDYLTDQRDIAIGVRVEVPFRHKTAIGVVVGISEKEKRSYKLKTISKVIDKKPILSAMMLSFLRFVANYYQSSLSEVLKAALPKKIRLGEAESLPKIKCIELIEANPELNARSHKQKALVDYLKAQTHPQAQSSLIDAGFSQQTIKALADKGIIRINEKEQSLEPLSDIDKDTPPALNKEQQSALKAISEHIDHFKVSLLFGVTGSGKTEVYFRTIDKVLAQNKQVLLLVPEIGLTPQLINRVNARFQVTLATLHSRLNDSERLCHWLRAKRGEADILIGTRSSVFTPLPRLGLIIIDEEHDLSLKQLDGVRYSARDMAIKRARELNIPVILGSATPSLESLHNAKNDKYQLLNLTHQAKTTEQTYYRIIDLRNQYLTDGLCDITLSHMRRHLEQKNQVLVFINRRGYSPVLICHQCGFKVGCPQCSAHMTVHYKDKRMQCHHCGYQKRLLKQCPDCQGQDLIPVGAGTERVSDYLTQVFSDYKVLRIDRDTVSQKESLNLKLAEIERGEADIIVGTQLLAKGHHFKNITLVVILDADAGLYSHDFRALERLGQSITQVAGRAGRESKGEVIIQTHLPDNPFLNELVQKGYRTFAETLLKEREKTAWPPYAYLALLRARGTRVDRLLQLFKSLNDNPIKRDNAVLALGPAPSPLAKKKGQFQMQLMLQSPTRTHLKKHLDHLRQYLKNQPDLLKGIHFSIDVDPLEMQ